MMMHRDLHNDIHMHTASQHENSLTQTTCTSYAEHSLYMQYVRVLGITAIAYINTHLTHTVENVCVERTREPRADLYIQPSRTTATRTMRARLSAARRQPATSYGLLFQDSKPRVELSEVCGLCRFFRVLLYTEHASLLSVVLGLLVIVEHNVDEGAFDINEFDIVSELIRKTFSLSASYLRGKCVNGSG